MALSSEINGAVPQPKVHTAPWNRNPWWMRVGLQIFGFPQYTNGIRYAPRVHDLCAACLGTKPAGLADEEDLALFRISSPRQLFYRLVPFAERRSARASVTRGPLSALGS